MVIKHGPRLQVIKVSGKVELIRVEEDSADASIEASDVTEVVSSNVEVTRGENVQGLSGWWVISCAQVNHVIICHSQCYVDGSTIVHSIISRQFSSLGLWAPPSNRNTRLYS